MHRHRQGREGYMPVQGQSAWGVVKDLTNEKSNLAQNMILWRCIYGQANKNTATGGGEARCLCRVNDHGGGKGVLTNNKSNLTQNVILWRCIYGQANKNTATGGGEEARCLPGSLINLQDIFCLLVVIRIRRC